MLRLLLFIFIRNNLLFNYLDIGTLDPLISAPLLATVSVGLGLRIVISNVTLNPTSSLTTTL